MMKSDEIFDWVIVGGGISGITIGEILSRNGHKVAIIEKNKLLASETTKDFHEWFHTGSLYTLLNDKRLAIRYSLGAIDDLLNFYSNFKGMNLKPTDKKFDLSTFNLGITRPADKLVVTFCSIVSKSVSFNVLPTVFDGA